MTELTPFWLSGEPSFGEGSLDVHSPYSGGLVGRVSLPTPAQVERAIADANAVRAELLALPAHARAKALDHVSARIAERADEFASLITAENGKPLMWSKGEVNRAVSTFRWAAEEARRWSGELQRLDTDPNATGRLGIVRRFPRGPVLGIAPFNFPLNLVAHKVAPAIAVGAPVLIKPASATPLTALLLASVIAETELPAGSVSVLPIPNDQMDAVNTDPRLPVISLAALAYTELFRTAPSIVLIYWFFFALPLLVGIDFTTFTAVALALGLQAGAYMAEVFRGGILAVKPGQWQAAKAIGMGPAMTLRHVVLPQAVRHMIPIFFTRVTELFKTTSLAAAISYAEVVQMASRTASETFRPIETFTVVALFFFLVIFAASRLVRLAERRLAIPE